ncbi:hypothetical protein C3L33_03838, partial [Rhododendron williamsianum]
MLHPVLIYNWGVTYAVAYGLAVTLVGMVFNKAERVTDVSFVIDDGTGRIDCNRWVNEAVDTKEVEAIS